MDDLTPETLAEWRKAAQSQQDHDDKHALLGDVRNHRILALLDALAAEQERSNTIPRYAMLDVWMALRGSDQSQAFEPFRDEHGHAETWARLMHDVRAEKAAREEAERELAICERVSQMNANAHMAEHARAKKAEAAYAALVARCKELARQMDGIPGERRASRALRALAEKEQDHG